MSTATKNSPPLQPPDEQFWQRYSPHHELPLAGMTSVFIHGLIIGGMALAAFLYLLGRESESNRPVNMDVVRLAPGIEEGSLAKADITGDFGGEHTEATPKTTGTGATPVPVPDVELDAARSADLEIPTIRFPEAKTDIDSALANLAKDADAQAAKPAPKAPPKTNVIGDAKPRGTGSQGTPSPGGVGKGKTGSGAGTGGQGGRGLTKSQINAARWHFRLGDDRLGDDPNGHVDQLRRIGFLLFLESPKGEIYKIKDLSRVPIELIEADIRKYDGFAQWTNKTATSLLGFSQILKLPFVPVRIHMYLPLDREKELESAEVRFLRTTGNNLNFVKETHFAFGLKNGNYEPEAIYQVNFDGRLIAKR